MDTDGGSPVSCKIPNVPNHRQFSTASRPLELLYSQNDTEVALPETYTHSSVRLL